LAHIDQQITFAVMKRLFFVSLLLLPAIIIAQYDGLLWKITHKNSKQPSYLFGTMHTTDSRAFTFSEQAKNKIEQCDAFAMELLMDDNSIDINLLMSLMMTDGSTLRSLFSEKEFHTLDSLLGNFIGFPLEMLDNIQPIVLIALLEQAGLGKDSSLPLDLFLMQHAKTKKKKLLGIETVAEQLSALQSLTYQEQAEMISAELSKQQNELNENDSLTHYYSAGKLDSLLALNNRNPMPEKLAKALLDNRNEIMAQRIEVFMKKESVFAAVGALHLPGANGVIERLRKKGFVVEAVR
jgi:uncharacterized protein YbaP (TraB family)